MLNTVERRLEDVCRLGVEDVREGRRHGFGNAKFGGLTYCGLRRRGAT